MKKIALFLSVIMVITLCGCGTSTKYYTNKAFLSEDTEAITYETSSNNVNWGEYQENKEDLTGRCVELSAESVVAVDETEFANIVKKFKNKLDVLEIPYAIGYNGDRAHRIHVQIEAEKIGLPILALLNINSSYDNVIVSGLGDFRASGVNSLKYELGADNKYLISVGVPETYQNDFEKYCAENIGKALYLKLGDMTFSSTLITEDMTKETIDFHGFSFLGKNVNELTYEIIMKLADYAVNYKYESPNNSTSFGLSIEGETLYGIPYVTELDEVLIERVSAKYPDVTFRRRGVENRIEFTFENSSKEVLRTEDYFDKIEDIYTMCNFDDGAYADIYFTWSSCEKKGYSDSVTFYKTGGKMICGYVSERIEDKANLNSFLLNHMKKEN